MRNLFFTVIVFLLAVYSVNAQRWSVGTNLIDYADFGTLNADVSFSVSRHWTLDAEWDYNPWTFKAGQPEQFQNRKLSGSFGARWWSWHSHAGWWVSMGGQYQIYNRGGLLRSTAEEGTAYGAYAGFGYGLLLGEWLNLDFGVGLWGGHKEYTVYRCTSCGRIDEQGSGFFVLPEDIMVSLKFVF